MKTKRKDDGGIIFTGNGDDEQKRGTDKVDFFYGNGGKDTFHGEGGNDEFYGGTSHDNLYGGAGDDTLRGGLGKDTFFYDSTDFGHDTIKDFKIGKDRLDFTGSGLSLANLTIREEVDADTKVVQTIITLDSENSITLEGVVKADLLYNFNDNITGLTGIYGTGGDDNEETDNKLTGDGESNEIFGLAGDDELAGGAGNDVLYGGDGDDELSGDAGNDTLRGGLGKDTFFYSSTEFGRDTIRDFKVGKDKLDFAGSGLSLADLEIGQNTAGHAVVTVKGTENRITLNKVSQADLEDNIESNIVGLSGIYGTGGDDNEETGNKLTGDGESNKIFGLAGDDELAGGAGDDELYGGDGDDELSGDAGNDTLTGGKGADTFLYGSRTFGEDVIEDFEDGTDKLDFAGSGLSLADLEIGQNTAGHAVVTVKGTENRITLNKVSQADLEDNIESNIVGLSGIYGTGGDDNEETGNKLTGDGESNKIFGLAGDDELAGGAGDDELYGGDGDDELSGDAGNDTLTGGKGADTFLYGSRTFGEDVIEDFEDGTDKLNVDGADLWFSDLTIETKDGNAVVTVKNGGTITLKNISGDAIDAHDFTGLKGIHGTEDNDDGTDNPSLTGTDADDRIFGYGGNDKLYGGVGDDRLFGGRQDFRIWGQ